MKRFATLLGVLLTVSLFLMACGGAEEAAPEVVTEEFTIVGYDEFRFESDNITVQQGSEVTVNFVNEGVLEHNWILVGENADLASVTDVDALSGANVGYVQPGEEGSVTFFAPGPGSYKMVCTVAGHAVGGMVGDFTVQ